MCIAIAITLRSQVAGHFGKAAAFMVYDSQGQFIERIENTGSKELGCKHKKVIQRRLSELGVKEIVLGNVGQRSLGRLLNAGFSVIKVPQRSSIDAVMTGKVEKEALTTAEQGRPCKRDKGDCGCGCAGKKKPVPIKIGTTMNRKSTIQGLTKIGGFTL
ncbi:hypothetical protein C9J48_21365 [Photobacterium profundum]|uniref:Dinitrogenase iron-molybdenum cofactor biosynthesis domain-containing protein n=1 Tax=Photobacterium profundum 3TCK TaxID=314280 RepID=Q1Z4C2_9GAMM|nr:NifB/NifX family molybdenum-iron cluster-binding protein [Photobacterium profundum]EAS43427.1 hypothetical protein P3TCK_24831 [Photobacterium profundum 3TCK]PSV59986.1 hypothetical protein C9J48_21365 [Photobacterium profundum]